MASPLSEIQSRLAIDAQGLGALRVQARNSPDAALEKVATQFEALFLQMLLKSMRDSVPQDGMFDNEATRTYVGMLDQQFAAGLSGKGKLGLSDILVKQLQRASAAAIEPGAEAIEPGAAALEPGAAVSAPARPAAAPSVIPAGGATAPTPFNPFNSFNAKGAYPPGPAIGTIDNIGPIGTGDLSLKHSAASPRVREFLERVGPQAQAASRETGIPARFIVAQAALESGWGRNEIRGADGAQSYNLFGIKAGRGWNGRTAESATTEYVNGEAVKITEKFRAYESYAEAFSDYARLLRSSGRYQGVLAGGDDPLKFARGLQQGGYATDPQYADKIARVINSTFSSRA